MVGFLLLAAQISADPATAVRELQAAIQAEPAKESNYTDLGNLLLSTQNFREAEIVLKHARTRFPQSAQAALSLGVAHYGQRQFPEAVGSFLDANKLDPDAEQPIAFLGRTLEHAGDRQPEVVEAFASFSRAHPKNFLGFFLSGKASHSEAALRKAIELNPGFWESHLELGNLLEASHDFAGAARSYQAAAKLAPKNPVPHYRLSRVYARMGDPAKASAERALHEKLSSDEKAELDRRQAAARHLDLKVNP